MVVLKRRGETQQVETENVIELSEPKSFASSQNAVFVAGVDRATKTEKAATSTIYSGRQSFVGAKTADAGAVMPKIDHKPKEVVAAKSSISSKTKVLLVAYIVIAVVLAAVVIGTGVAISEAGRRTSGLEQRISGVSALMDTQAPILRSVNDPEVIVEAAGDYGLTHIVEPVEIELVGTVSAVSYSETTNFWDKLFDFISEIFT